MKKVSQSGAAVLDVLTEGLDEPGDHRRFGEPGGAFMPVSVEKIGPDQWSVAHYYEQMGDLMADPEIVFLRVDEDWYPVYFKQANLGIENFSVEFGPQGEITGTRPRMQADQATFAGTWMRNIKEQQGLRVPRRGAVAERKLGKRQLEKEIEQIYYKHGQNVEINVLDIGKIFEAGKAAYAAGLPLEDAIIDAIAQYRLN